MRLTQKIDGTRFEVYAREKGFKKYAKQGSVYAGDFQFVPLLGDGVIRPKKTPPEGKEWIRDYNHHYWEVSRQELLDNSTSELDQSNEPTKTS